MRRGPARGRHKNTGDDARLDGAAHSAHARDGELQRRVSKLSAFDMARQRWVPAFAGTSGRGYRPAQSTLRTRSRCMPKPIEYADASAQMRAVYDDIKRTRNVPDVNNFWKYLAHDPATLKRTWESIKEIMTPGALDALTKEMVYLAVSVTNGCAYCIASHTAAARKAGMTDAMFAELMAVTGMANETNRLANGYRVPVDPAFQD